MFPRQFYIANARRFYYQLSEFYNPEKKVAAVLAESGALDKEKKFDAPQIRKEWLSLKTHNQYEAKTEVPNFESKTYALKKKPEGNYCFVEIKSNDTKPTTNNSTVGKQTHKKSNIILSNPITKKAETFGTVSPMQKSNFEFLSPVNSKFEGSFITKAEVRTNNQNLENYFLIPVSTKSDPANPFYSPELNSDVESTVSDMPCFTPNFGCDNFKEPLELSYEKLCNAVEQSISEIPNHYSNFEESVDERFANVELAASEIPSYVPVNFESSYNHEPLDLSYPVFSHVENAASAIPCYAANVELAFRNEPLEFGYGGFFKDEKSTAEIPNYTQNVKKVCFEEPLKLSYENISKVEQEASEIPCYTPNSETSQYKETKYALRNTADDANSLRYANAIMQAVSESYTPVKTKDVKKYLLNQKYVRNHLFFDNSFIEKSIERKNDVTAMESEIGRRYVGLPTFANSNTFPDLNTAEDEAKETDEDSSTYQPYHFSNEAISDLFVKEPRKKLNVPTFKRSNVFKKKPVALNTAEDEDQETDEDSNTYQPYHFSNEAMDDLFVKEPRKKLNVPTFKRSNVFKKKPVAATEFSDLNEYQPRRRPISQTASRRYLGLPTFINPSEQHAPQAFRQAVPAKPANINIYKSYNGAPGLFDYLHWKKGKMPKAGFSTYLQSRTNAQVSAANNVNCLPNVFYTPILTRTLDTSVTFDEDGSNMKSKQKLFKKMSSPLVRLRRWFKKSSVNVSKKSNL